MWLASDFTQGLKPLILSGFDGTAKAVPLQSILVRRRLILLASIGTLALLAGCSKEAKDPEPEVSVQVASVEQTTILHTVSAEAILFPLEQAAITPKISAPVKTFYVKRGSRVHQGQLLAVLENKDLEAAAADNRGAYEQAQASFQTTTAASLPEELQKSKLDMQAAQQMLDAQEKLYKSRQDCSSRVLCRAKISTRQGCR